MMNKNYTMYDPKQIAKKGYKGCKTSTSVMNFCKKNHVDCCWWKPSGTSQKVLMIEWSSFRNTWKDCQKTMNQSTNKTSKTNRTTAKGSSKIAGRIGTQTKGRSNRTTWASGKTTRQTRMRRAA